MTELFRSYTRYTSEKIGQIHDVLICEMATDGVHYVGHNKSYEHILVPTINGHDLLGKWAKVKITEVAKFYMKSVILEADRGNIDLNSIPAKKVERKESTVVYDKKNNNGWNIRTNDITLAIFVAGFAYLLLKLLL